MILLYLSINLNFIWCKLNLFKKSNFFCSSFELFHKCTENKISHDGHNFCRQVTKCTCNNNKFPQEWTALEKRTCSCCHCCLAILPNLVSKSDKDSLVKASPLLIHKVKFAKRKQQKVWLMVCAWWSLVIKFSIEKRNYSEL